MFFFATFGDFFFLVKSIKKIHERTLENQNVAQRREAQLIIVHLDLIFFSDMHNIFLTNRKWLHIELFK